MSDGTELSFSIRTEELHRLLMHGLVFIEMGHFANAVKELGLSRLQVYSVHGNDRISFTFLPHGSEDSA